MSSDPLLIFATRRKGFDRAALRAFAARLRDEVADGATFCARITSDRELRQLNHDFLGKDYATDVLSFPAPSPDGALGDIAISVERAEAQASEFGHDTTTEIEVLLLHGVLHLLGYDHETDRGRMKRAETKWRQALELPGGLIERARQAEPEKSKPKAAKERAKR